LLDELLTDLHRQASLADATRAGEREQSDIGTAQKGDKVRNLSIPANERRRWN
jgi:hypothetical protein